MEATLTTREKVSSLGIIYVKGNKFIFGKFNVVTPSFLLFHKYFLNSLGDLELSSF